MQAAVRMQMREFASANYDIRAGSFVITANGYPDFARAIKLKLLREIRVLTGDVDQSVLRYAELPAR